MSNIALANVQVPAHLAARINKPSVLAQSMTGGIGQGGGPRISIKGARFRIVDGDTETVLPTLTLDVIVVGANPRLSKTWYAKAWSADSEPVSPDCYSLDGVGPAVDSTQPQNDLCATCPQNSWGSKVTPQGKQIKACADQKRLAVVAADDPTGPIYLLQVTPAALRDLNQYQKELTMRGIPPEIVKTQVGFDTDASFPKLTFGFGGFLSEEQLEAVENLFGSAEVQEVTGEAAVSRPVDVPKLANQAVATPAPVVKEEPAAEPAKPVRGFGAKAAAQAAVAKEEPVKQAAAPRQTAAEVKTVEATNDLASEIAGLIGDMGLGADDA